MILSPTAAGQRDCDGVRDQRESAAPPSTTSQKAMVALNAEPKFAEPQREEATRAKQDGKVGDHAAAKASADGLCGCGSRAFTFLFLPLSFFV
jgi:hypothetical protein